MQVIETREHGIVDHHIAGYDNVNELLVKPDPHE